MTEVIKNEQITLDYQHFKEVEFVNCTIIYKGGQIPNMENVEFTKCRFVFDNEAKNTLNFLSVLDDSDPNPDGGIVDQLLGRSS